MCVCCTQDLVKVVWTLQTRGGGGNCCFWDIKCIFLYFRLQWLKYEIRLHIRRTMAKDILTLKYVSRVTAKLSHYQDLQWEGDILILFGWEIGYVKIMKVSQALGKTIGDFWTVFFFKKWWLYINQSDIPKLCCNKSYFYFQKNTFITTEKTHREIWRWIYWRKDERSSEVFEKVSLSIILQASLKPPGILYSICMCVSWRVHFVNLKCYGAGAAKRSRCLSHNHKTMHPRSVNGYSF